ncbi:MAG: MFS transporter [Pararhizobium sp.]
MSSYPPTPRPDGAPPGYGMRLSTAYAAAFAANGIMLPYFPIWLKSLSLSDWEIGIVLAMPMVMRVTTAPFIASAADRTRDRADVLFLLAVGGLIATLFFFFVGSFAAVTAVVILQAVLVAPQAPLIDAITLTSVRRYMADYGSIRVWGSIGFVVTNVVGGLLIGRSGGGIVPLMLVATNLLVVVAALIAPRFGRPRRASPLAGVTLQAARGALMRPDFLMIMAGGAIIQGSHAMLYAFSAIYWSGEGISGTLIGLLWATGVCGEILLFQFSRPIVNRIGVGRLIGLGGSVAVIRWLVFPLGLGLPEFFVLQLCHAGSFAAIHLGLQRTIAARVEDEQGGAAQGLMFCLVNAAMGLATVWSGYLYADFGVRGFFAMAAIALAGTALAVAGLVRSRAGDRALDG